MKNRYGKISTITKMKSIICLFVLCLFLSGCSLAVPGAGADEEKEQDRLIGVFVTTEYVDLMDMESYLQEHVDELIDGETIWVDNTDAYKSKLYATIDKHDSKEPLDWEIDFKGVEGVNFFRAMWQNDGEEAFSMLSGGDAISDVTTHLYMTDGGESVDLTGTIYVRRDSGKYRFYMNPVYQTASGEIYMTGGDSGSIGGMEDGGSFSMSLKEDMSVTENGVTTGYSTSVEVKFTVMDEPEQIRLHYMDEKLNILYTEEYAPGALPEKLVAKEGTVCVVVEMVFENGTVSRELFEVTEENIAIETFSPVGEWALEKCRTEIVLGGIS